ncbi:MAG: sensor histidine kinase [Synergistaceae bacterium]|nr:sensor histidine kinase [Synergistaceae bacterium]
MNEEKRTQQILDAIFSSIFDPVSVYRVVKGRSDKLIDLEYERINDAYLKYYLTGKGFIKREDVIGRLYTEIWAGEENIGWENLMLRVASAECATFNEETNRYENSGYFEGQSSIIPGYYQMFAFSPIAGHVVSIFRDMSDLHTATKDLSIKEKQLIESREGLRKLTTSLTLAEEKTRRSIATTLHDTLGYSMVSLLHALKDLRTSELTPDEKENKLAQITYDMEKLIDDTRNFTFSISPPLLYELGLNAALESRCESIRASASIDCIFLTHGSEKKIPEDTKILLYQMAHELLANVSKHAKASRVLVQTRWGTKKIQLLVEDNGIGFTNGTFEQNIKKFSGMGLFSIRERLKTMGGKFDIVSEPGKGTTVSIVVPIKL